jgi:hypothetical protein
MEFPALSLLVLDHVDGVIHGIVQLEERLLAGEHLFSS